MCEENVRWIPYQLQCFPSHARPGDPRILE